MTETVLHPAYVYDLLAEPRSFAEVDRLQLDLSAARSQGAVPDTIILCEHPPTLTLGRASDAAAELVGGEEPYRALGWEVLRADRGGRSTWHGPGQLVCYPILDLRDHGKDLRQYAHDLERVLIEALADARDQRGRRRGPRARRRLGRGPQDRVTRHPRRQLGRAPRLRAQRRLRPRRVRALPRRAASTRRRSRASRRSSAATSGSPTRAAPCSTRSRACSRSSCRRSPPDAPHRRHHDLLVEPGAVRGVLRRGPRDAPRPRRGRLLGAPRRRRDPRRGRREAARARPRLLRAGRHPRAHRGRRLRRASSARSWVAASS